MFSHHVKKKKYVKIVMCDLGSLASTRHQTSMRQNEGIMPWERQQSKATQLLRPRCRLPVRVQPHTTAKGIPSRPTLPPPSSLPFPQELRRGLLRSNPNAAGEPRCVRKIQQSTSAFSWRSVLSDRYETKHLPEK